MNHPFGSHAWHPPALMPCHGKSTAFERSGCLLQVVSIALVPHNVTVALQGLPAGTSSAGGELTVLTGPGPLAENSFEQPLNVSHIIMPT